MYKIVIIYALLIIFYNNNSFSQCCLAGNPQQFDNPNMLVMDGNILFGLNHRYSYSDAYYNGLKRLDKTYMESYFNFSSVFVNYGISENLQLTSELGYFLNKAQNFVNEDYLRYSSGLADLNLGLIYRIFQSDDRLFNILQTFSLTLPIGDFNKEYDGIVLPIDLQPSSGNYKYSLGLMLLKNFADNPLLLNLTAIAELPQNIETKHSFHKYGNFFNVSAGATYPVFDELIGGLNFRFESREKALSGSKTENNIFSYINATGGDFLFITPRLIIVISQNLAINLMFDYPIYKNPNSEQLTNNFAFSIGILNNYLLH